MSKMDYTGRHTFPLLKISTIIKCINEMHIPIAEEDITKPSSARIMTIYDSITDILMGCTRQQFEQPSFAVMQILEQPDLHQESLSLMAYYRQLRKFMLDIGIDDFSMRDLLKPEPRRVRRCFSAVINFAKFREEKMMLFETCTRKAEEALVTREQLELNNHSLNEKLNAIKTLREQQEPEVQRLREQNAALTNTLREAKRQQTNLKEESDNLKQTKEELQTSVDQAEKSITQLRQEIQRIRSRIVKNPDQLKQSIADTASTLQGEKASITATAKRLHDLESRLSMMEVVEQGLVGCLKLMQDCCDERAVLAQAQGKATAGKDAIDLSQKTIRDIEVQLQQLKRRVASSHERITKLTNHQRIKDQKKDAKLKSLQEEYDVVLQERADAVKKCEENEEKAVDMEEKSSNIRQQDNVDATVIEDLMRELKTQTSLYTSTLERSIASAAFA